MVRSPASVPTSLALVVLCAALALAGCGEDPQPQTTAGPPPAWSDPAGTQAQGTPDGEAGGVLTAATALGRLRALVETGAAAGRRDVDKDVEALALLLWDSNGTPEERAPAQVHVQLTAIAAEAGGWLAASKDARAERPDEATSFEIHDAWLAATARGPGAYAAWCAGDGAGLLQEREAALRERFFPKRR